jgi:type IV secretory pathway VirD2 relaxase
LANASSVRGKLYSFVKRSPQVIVRISGGGRSIRHIKAHINYISRNGQLTVEDQNGDRLVGKEYLAALAEEWRLGGFAIDDRATSRQAFNVVLSMPAGTSEVAVWRAAREFAQSEFPSFQYAMVLHTHQTDPDKDPSPHPHVHLCVKARGLDGTKLNPRKNDIHRWRESFADRLRENGVECDASPRQQRFRRERGEKQSVLHMKSRGQKPAQVGMGSADAAAVRKAKQTASRILAGYHKLASALARSESALDRKLAADLAERVGLMRSPIARETELPRDR